MLETLVALLGASVIAVPVTRLLGLGSILGYLIAGVAIGPAGFGLVRQSGQITAVSELGVVMLLFLIGLELRPHRLWILRGTILALGLGQLVPTAIALALLAHLSGIAWNSAIVLGAGLALSSTAIVLPMLADRKLLSTTAGRDGFAVLLFQDIMFIPLVALVPLLAGHGMVALPNHLPTAADVPWKAVARGLVAVAAILVGGTLAVPHIFRLVGRLRSPEVFTATALLLVIGTAALASWAGLSTSLGAFMAGVMLSDSEYRHAIQTDIEPFEGLLLGFFFISVGMAADLSLVLRDPGEILAGLVALMAIKTAIAFAVGWFKRRNLASALRFAAALPEGSEFSFVLFAAATAAGVLQKSAAELATLIIALSMIATPILFAGSERLLIPRLQPKRETRPADRIEPSDTPVIICGFGRMGQIIGRVLSLQRIAYTALDADARRIDTVRRFGPKIYFGDPTRLDLLRSAGAERAKILVIALDDAETILTLAAMVRREFPHLAIIARAHDRNHAHRLMDLGITEIVRETYFSALRLSELTLDRLGIGTAVAKRTVALFRAHDEKLLQETHAYADDERRMIQTTEQAAAELADLLEADRQRGAETT
ncbi:monovalent cation:proton antiporter-2 (CPA2) family protein [Acidocella sp.]|jgi:CPA2 family monovalent cation:H+ antiporter-2/glutathione-regulated potassium-efflux system protein KefB|uniref:monovalent cation:proton antiporter-2 (CPA2) family protein n=1 Tax=Acidocella sp. TaxID=50710 RepID=UPI002F420751